MSKYNDYLRNDGGSLVNNSSGPFFSLTYKENLANELPHGICRLCGAYDVYRDGVCRVKVQDGFGEVCYYRCHRCDGSGEEPPTRIWDGVWYKPWTWAKHHYEVL